MFSVQKVQSARQGLLPCRPFIATVDDAVLQPGLSGDEVQFPETDGCL